MSEKDRNSINIEVANVQGIILSLNDGYKPGQTIRYIKD